MPADTFRPPAGPAIGHSADHPTDHPTDHPAVHSNARVSDPAAVPGGASLSLSARLRDGTRHLHAQAERAGLMPALLRGELPLHRYVRLLQELQALYDALESALAQPGAPVLDAALFRAAALREDLAVLGAMRTPPPTGDRGLAREAEVPARAPTADVPDGSPVMRDYVRHLRSLSPPLLAAHAYVRYLGDLAGGQVLRRIVARSYGLQGVGTRFYEFGPAVPGLVAGLRLVLDALPATMHEPIVDEACSAFRRHVDLFEDLAA